MVWKDHVNVLDQWRIFRLLAKGPRLDNYLTQLKNAEKLDFASWGGFAQNFAGRRIPFENAAYSTYWNRAMGDSLHIPTFAAGASGPYLPGAAPSKARCAPAWFRQLARRHAAGCVGPREGERAAAPAGGYRWKSRRSVPAGANRMRFVGAGDSDVVPTAKFKIYLLRTSTLQPRGPATSRSAGSRARAAPWTARAPTRARPRSPKWPRPGTTFRAMWHEKISSNSPRCGDPSAGRK
jgi:CRISPR-associated protein Csm5